MEKIDFKTKEKPFLDMSYSSVDDLEKILFMFDLIVQEKDKFNFEAMAIYIDIINSVDEKRHEIIHEYLLIQRGVKPLGKYEDDILEAIACRKKIHIGLCKKRYARELRGLVKENKEKWIDSVLNCNIYTDRGTKMKYGYEEDVDKENLKIDHIRKHVIPSRKYPEVHNTKDLDDLTTYQGFNEKRIKELKGIKLKDRTFQERGELNKRIKWDKELFDDIKELRFHYGLINENEFAKKRENTNRVRNEEEIDHVLFDEWELHKIRSIAEEKLTIKQYLIFNLYYLIGFTQQEIADTLGDKRANISRDIGLIKSKIIKNIVF